jgi:tetratricopeptide (TPR) repeat protein
MDKKENKDLALHLTIVGIFLLVIFSSCSASNFLTNNGQSSISRTQRYKITKKDLTQFTSTLRPRKQNPDALYRQACYLQRIKKDKLALQVLEELILSDPTNIKAYNAMGVSYDHLGDHLRAIEAYKRALKLNPDRAYVHNNLGYSYLLHADLDAAIVAFKKAIELDDKKAKYHNNLALAYAKKGLYDLALIEFKMVGDEAKARHNITKIYRQNDHNQENEIHFAKASKLKPNTTENIRVPQTASAHAKNINAGEVEEIYDSILQSPYRIEIDGKGRKKYRSKINSSPSQNIQIEETKMNSVVAHTHKELKMNDFKKGIRTDDIQKNFEIEISNGNGVNRMARRVGNYLNSKGFNVKRLTNANHFNFDETKIYYLDDYLQDAFDVAKQIPGYQQMEQVEEFERHRIKIKVLIGKDIVPYNKLFHKSAKES